ncbi:4'-phosphopantetheinyl transferase family protein [Spongiactinospora sp. 9N601]|uniref:4'-phosphopantetheinyl transferase family protein n=1 Tax=Spongiactinospora sp. 9N601 TaxID=3375149 RepID=UPI0037BA0E69
MAQIQLPAPAGAAPPGRLPAQGEVWVWWSRVRSDLAAAYLARNAMSAEETSRLAAMRRAAARDRFVLGSALMRSAAGHHLGLPPERVVVDRRCATCGKPHGKPAIPGGSGLEISLSHTDALVVCAVARRTPIGVDVEDGAALLDGDAVAGMVLAPGEETAYRDLPPAGRRAALLTYWTRKEALLKATGDGLRVPMRRIEVTGPREDPRVIRWEQGPEPESLSMVTLRGPAGRFLGPAVAALAVIGEPPHHLVELDATSTFTARSDHDG